MTPEEYKKHLDENMDRLADDMPDAAIPKMALDAMLFPVCVIGIGLVIGASLGLTVGVFGGATMVLLAVLGWLVG